MLHAGRRESASIDGVPGHQYAYRNYTDDMYAMYVDVIRKSYLSCQQVSSKVERPLSLPVSVSNAMPDRRCKLKTTFYPQVTLTHLCLRTQKQLNRKC